MLTLRNLNERTRQLMVDELAQDQANENVYYSPRLSNIGHHDWENLLEAAFRNGTDAMLADSLRAGQLSQYETKGKPNGGTTNARVPVNAPEILAEGEFNRFYIRAVCRCIIQDGGPKSSCTARRKSRSRVRSRRPRSAHGWTQRRSCKICARTWELTPLSASQPGPTRGSASTCHSTRRKTRNGRTRRVPLRR